MCVRLYPDIIVAAEINSSIFWDGIEKPIVVSIDDCIAHQKNYTRFGFSNPFIGYDDREWNEKDYLYYFRKLPQYFKEVSYQQYEVSIDVLKDEKGKIHFEKILIEGAYKNEELIPFRLLPELQRSDLNHGQKKIGTLKRN